MAVDTEKLSSLVREFEKVSDRKMLKVNERKSKVLKFRLSGEEIGRAHV